MYDLDNQEGAPLLLYLPFKGKGGNDRYETILEVRALSKIELKKLKERIGELISDFRSSCKNLPIKMVIQNTPRGSYIRWRTSSKGGMKQKYISSKDVLNLRVNEISRKLLSEYCHKVNWINMMVSMLHHNVMAINKYLKDQLLISELDKA